MFDFLYENNSRTARMRDGDERIFTDNILILPPDKINTDPPAMTQQKDYNQVLHLMVRKCPMLYLSILSNSTL